MSVLTEYGIAAASWLTWAAVYVKVGMTIGSPLSQDAGTGVKDVHEMGITGIYVPGTVVAHVEEYWWVQT